MQTPAGIETEAMSAKASAGKDDEKQSVSACVIGVRFVGGRWELTDGVEPVTVKKMKPKKPWRGHRSRRAGKGKRESQADPGGSKEGEARSGRVDAGGYPGEEDEEDEEDQWPNGEDQMEREGEAGEEAEEGCGTREELERQMRAANRKWHEQHEDSASPRGGIPAGTAPVSGESSRGITCPSGVEDGGRAKRACGAFTKSAVGPKAKEGSAASDREGVAEVPVDGGESIGQQKQHVLPLSAMTRIVEAEGEGRVEECPLCLGSGKRNVFVPCAHNVCGGCADRFIVVRVGGSTCPVCEGGLSEPWIMPAEDWVRGGGRITEYAPRQ